MLLSPQPKMQFLGDDGNPLAGGLVYTYAKGTTTPQVTYTDFGGVSANANPIILDTYGRCDIWFQQLSYTILVYNSVGVLQGCSGDISFPDVTASGTSAEVYADDVPYSFPDQVIGSDGYTYRCIGVDILDDDPVGSTTGNWVNLSPSNFASPAFTGVPTAPTAATSVNTTQLATTAFAKSVAGGVGIQVFTSSGTYTPTAGTNKVVVELVGGGGGGAGILAGSNAASSGSAGGYSRKIISMSGITTVTITVGAGGAAGSAGGNGGAGGTTSFGSHCSATGGGAGNYNANAGAPGVGSGGNINLYGGYGGGGSGNADASGGSGGASFFGGGGAHGGPSGYNGVAALCPGSGGGGARSYNSGNAIGGAGAAGIVIITEY